MNLASDDLFASDEEEDDVFDLMKPKKSPSLVKAASMMNKK